ncbi:MAG: aspartyl/asparaginyl beta-hydroxylase domain-containing protein [Waterburya sp.]
MKRTTTFQFSLREVIVDKLGKNILWSLEKILTRYSLVATTPFLESSQFSWVSLLESNWQVIKEELNLILHYTEHLPSFQDISPDQARITQDNLWKTFFLYGYGVKMQRNCDYCPQTTQIIEQIPGLKTAFFSILLPDKHIPEHRGPYKGVLRCHLPLKVPQAKEQCGIRVAQEIRHWEEGKCLVFDDSYPHEAWNKTDEIRVVLFLDIVRPTSFPASLLNHFLLNLIRWSPFIQDAQKNQNQWNQRLARVFK